MSCEVSEQLEKQFLDLARESWKTHQMFFWNSCVDEIIIGYVVTTTINKGYTLLEILNEENKSSDNKDYTLSMLSTNSHYLLFENNNDKSRLIYKLERIARDLFESKHFGQLSRITIGYGEKSDNVAKICSIIDKEYDENIPLPVDPGVIKIVPDEKNGYFYAQVSLIFNISKYNKDDQMANIDMSKIDYDIASILYSLKKYLDAIK